MLLGLSFLFSVMLRVPYYQHALTFIDEGIYGTTAFVLHEGSILYRDIWCGHQPLPMILSCLTFHAFGVSSFALHLESFLLAWLACLAVYLVGSRCFSRRIGGLAALTYAIASTSFYTPRIIGMTAEQVMVVLETASVLFFLRGLHTRDRGTAILAGIFAAAAFFAKPAAASLLPLLVAFPLLHSRGQGLSQSLNVGAGYAAGAAMILAYVAAQGALNAWWDQSIVFRIHYVQNVGLLSFLKQLLRQPFSFGLIYLWAWVLIVFGRKGGLQNRTVFSFLGAWLGVAFAGVMIGRRFYANYYIQMFPPLSLMVAVGLDYLLQHKSERREARVLKSALIIFLVPFLWFHSRTAAHWYYLFDARSHQNVQLWEMCVIDRNLQGISDYIRETSRPNDRMFVWGINPEYYFLTRLMPATRYPWFAVRSHDEPPYTLREETETETALRAKPPAVLVDAVKEGRMAETVRWKDIVEDLYVLDREIAGVRIYRRSQSR